MPMPFEKPRELKDLWRVPDSQMTPEEKLLRYGEGNPGTMLYRKIKNGGVETVVARTFKPGDEIPEGWVDSPALLGMETEPTAGPHADSDYDAVIGSMPVARPSKSG